MDDDVTEAHPAPHHAPRILLLAPPPGLPEGVRERLARNHVVVSVHRVDTTPALAARLVEEMWNLVVIAGAGPGSTLLAALSLAREFAPDCPAILLVAPDSADGLAVELLRAGASDVIPTDRPLRLAFAAERLLREASALRVRGVAHQRTRRLAYHDTVTELPNFHGLRERFNRTRPESGRGVAIVAVRLHHLEDLVELIEARHLDTLLRSIVFRYSSIIRSPAFLSHLATDTFVACLPGASANGAGEVAEALAVAAAAPLSSGALRARVHVTVGIATGGDAGVRLETLLRCALGAARAAHERGDHVAIGDVDGFTPPLRQQRLLTDLWGANERRELTLGFRPLVNHHLRRTPAFEAVPRWRHPQLGTIHEAELMPLLAWAGDLQELTRWLVRESVTACARWREAGLELGVQVKVVASMIRDAGLASLVANELALVGLPGTALTLAIPAAAFATSPLAARRALTQLAELDVSVVLDGFAPPTDGARAVRRPADGTEEVREPPGDPQPILAGFDACFPEGGHPPDR